jgi:hypothetical protein
MKTIDVDGLPEPVAQAIAALVQAIRAQLRTQAEAHPPQKVELPSWPGNVTSRLTREEIYEDID